MMGTEKVCRSIVEQCASYLNRGILMVIRAYYDGSGKDCDRHLTLGSIAGTETSIPRLEHDWNKVLQKHEVSCFHAHEAMQRRGEFEGWEDQELRSLIYDLVNVVGKHIAMREENEKALLGSVCTIKLDDYKRVRSRSGSAYPLPNYICLNDCFGIVLQLDGMLHENPNKAGIQLFFDRNESFKGVLQNLWQRERKKRIWWKERVVGIYPVDMKQTRLVQAADLIAWAANRYWSCLKLCEEGRNDTWIIMFPILAMTWRLYYSYYDEEGLTQVYDKYGNAIPNAHPPLPMLQFPGGTTLSFRDDSEQSS